MRALHLYFRLHRAYELVAPEGGELSYFGGEADFREANRTEYQPLFALLERNAQKYPNLHVSLSISGIWLEQAEKFDPELIRRLKKLVNLGTVQLLAQPYDYSLAWFYDMDEFETQVEMLLTKLMQVFGVKPEILALPELIYHDKIAKWAKDHGFSGVLAGAVEGILGFRSPNQVFEAKDVDDLRIICQNTRFSRAIRQGEELVMIEQDEPKMTLETTNLVAPEPKSPTRRTTAQEFIKGFTGTGRASEREIEPAKLPKAMRWMVFSAKKCQKGLEIESLRGNLISICLAPEIFREYREAGIIRFFDELFAGWLNVSGNKFVNAREICEMMAPKHEISVKTTIDWRETVGKTIKKAKNSDLARIEDICYCPPEWLRGVKQVELAKKLYNLRFEIARTKDRDLYRDFQKLTALDYMAAMGARTPQLVGESVAHDPVELKQVEEKFKKILDDFAKRIEAKMPQPPKLSEKAGVKNNIKTEKAPKEDDFSVKVTRVASQKKKATGLKTAKKPTYEAPREVDWDDLVWGDENDMYKTLDHAEEVLDYVNTDEPVFYDDAEDIVEAELAMLEERMTRKKSIAEQNLKDLIEAELVSIEKKVTKKVKKKIVLE